MEEEKITKEDIIKALDKLKDMGKPLTEQEWEEYEKYKKYRYNKLPEGKNIIYGREK